MELKCKVQNYAWGKLGESSAVASFAAEKIEAAWPYAELWMGTHPNGPSTLQDNNKTLKDYIAENPKEILGNACLEKFNGELPFLFKILSVNKALSIQAHPDKKLAEKLHAERPEIYKDPNHKPEMAIALTDFEGLCGFRPIQEIREFIDKIPQLNFVCQCESLSDFMSSTNQETISELLKNVFTTLMNRDKLVLAEQLKSLEDELTNSVDGVDRCKELFLRLMTQYPNDVGCFVIYFLNHVTLKPDEAMFLGPNLPHAYLSGDCVECMACSDNVVRSGLTPKLIDVDTLCDMLLYESTTSEKVKFKPVQRDDHTVDYIAPVPDFSVAKICVGKGEKKTFISRESASIVIITDGQSDKYKKGQVLFLNADEDLTLENIERDILAFQAFC